MPWSYQVAWKITVSETDLPEGTMLSNVMPGEHRNPNARILAADLGDDVELVQHEDIDHGPFEMVAAPASHDAD